MYLNRPLHPQSPVHLIKRTLTSRRCAGLWRPILLCLTFIFATLGVVQAQGITITSPKGSASSTSKAPIENTGGGKLVLKFTVSDAAKTPKIRIIASVHGDTNKAEYTVQANIPEQRVTVNLFRGTNEIRLFGHSGSGPSASSPEAFLWITCDDDECGKAKDLISTDGSGLAPVQPPSPDNGNIILKEPVGDVKEGPLESLIQVKGGIKKLSIAVFNSERTLVDFNPAVEVRPWDDKVGVATAKLKLVNGQNIIRVFDADPAKLGEKANEALVIINCTGGDKCGKLETATAAKSEQKGSVKIVGDKSVTTDQSEATIQVEVEKKEGDGDKFLNVAVKNNNKVVPQDKDGSHKIEAAKLGKPVNLSVKVNEGLNKVTVFEANKEKTDVDFADVTRVNPSLITVNTPEADTTFPTSFYPASLTIAKADKPINKIKYRVMHEGVQVVDPRDVEAIDVDNSGDKGKALVPIKFVAGRNEVTFFDSENLDDKKRQATIVVNCAGPKCATDFLVSTIPTNSRFTRVIVGMEQAGASSAESKTSPFVDFFFTTPLLFNTLKDKQKKAILGPDGEAIRVERFGAWSQLRFSASPQQIGSFAVFPANFVNQVSDPTKAVDLVQSFDFLGGVEFRAFTANGWSYTLIPGIKQRTRFSFTAAGGTITPLAAKRETAQVFEMPAVGSPQRAEFESRFGKPPGGTTYVGFVPLERDRFFRQYYFGFRLKTHYCEDAACQRYKNRFPSIVDFGFGQNEAATGGRLTSDIRDSANNTIGTRRNWVLRFDGFFPLPFKEANFLYLFGTAVMKVAGGSVKIQTPLFLESPGTTVPITDIRVYIPPAELQPTRVDRDYYKIGIGVNLTDLFNRNKVPPQ